MEFGDLVVTRDVVRRMLRVRRTGAGVLTDQEAVIIARNRMNRLQPKTAKNWQVTGVYRVYSRCVDIWLTLRTSKK